MPRCHLASWTPWDFTGRDMVYVDPVENWISDKKKHVFQRWEVNIPWFWVWTTIFIPWFWGWWLPSKFFFVQVLILAHPQEIGEMPWLYSQSSAWQFRMFDKLSRNGITPIDGFLLISHSIWEIKSDGSAPLFHTGCHKQNYDGDLCNQTGAWNDGVYL